MNSDHLKCSPATQWRKESALLIGQDALFTGMFLLYFGRKEGVGRTVQVSLLFIPAEHSSAHQLSSDLDSATIRGYLQPNKGSTFQAFSLPFCTPCELTLHSPFPWFHIQEFISIQILRKDFFLPSLVRVQRLT